MIEPPVGSHRWSMYKLTPRWSPPAAHQWAERMQAPLCKRRKSCVIARKRSDRSGLNHREIATLLRKNLMVTPASSPCFSKFSGETNDLILPLHRAKESDLPHNSYARTAPVWIHCGRASEGDPVALPPLRGPRPYKRSNSHCGVNFSAYPERTLK